MHEQAAKWIVELLNTRNIPFLICGGLAAKGYGAARELNDIDLFVPAEHFDEVVQAGQAYISKAAAHRQEEGWDLTYVQFKYAGVKVEVGSTASLRILDAASQHWVPLIIDFQCFKTMNLLGMDMPVMRQEDLAYYKGLLARDVDIEDIQAMERANSL